MGLNEEKSMATIELRGISHSYQMERCGVLPEECRPDAQFVIRDLDLTWEKGSANALLGPSGCGKTTILNMISGLLKPTAGYILYDGRDVTEDPPEKRHIAQVFQFPVVYDTISVYRNLAFPLKNAKVSKADIKRKVQQVAEILDLTHVLDRSAGRISQAEKQKVSLGRGIIREDTVAILFDEPLTVIDPKEKYVLRRKIREVQKELAITTIYVTHDQHEALTFADRVTVMANGRVVQTGTPAELHAEPASPFIGYFIGSPGMNLLDCRLDESGLRCGDVAMPISSGLRATLAPHGREFQLGIRPEFVQVSLTEKPNFCLWKVNLMENVGVHLILTLSSNGIKIKSRVPTQERVSAGARVWAGFPEAHVKIFKNDIRVY
jgi:glycerol transport system ATP-binding protein